MLIKKILPYKKTWESMFVVFIVKELFESVYSYSDTRQIPPWKIATRIIATQKNCHPENCHQGKIPCVVIQHTCLQTPRVFFSNTSVCEKNGSLFDRLLFNVPQVFQKTKMHGLLKITNHIHNVERNSTLIVSRRLCRRVRKYTMPV